MPYRLTSDDDGHWYVIPADKNDEWENWVGEPETTDYEPPSWAESIGGHPNLVTFDHYTIR